MILLLYLINEIPESILLNTELNDAIKAFPENYNLEIHKCIWRIEKCKKELKKENLLICLQMPEGLHLYGCMLSDIFEYFTRSECYILCDVTYGACCIDDFAAD